MADYRGTTPLSLAAVEPGTHRLRMEMHGRFPFKRELTLGPAESLAVSVKGEELASRRRWATYAAYGTAAAALVPFSAGAVFGTLGRVDASGPTRRDAQADLEQRVQYATTANVLFIFGGALVASSIFTFIWLRRDIAGD
jgi:hypothetical protein